MKISLRWALALAAVGITLATSACSKPKPPATPPSGQPDPPRAVCPPTTEYKNCPPR